MPPQARRVGAKPPVEREPYSLWVCGLKNPVRKRLIEIVENKFFEVMHKINVHHIFISTKSNTHPNNLHQPPI